MKMFNVTLLMGLFLLPPTILAAEPIGNNKINKNENVEKNLTKEDLLTIQSDDNVLGQANAKVTILEYSSLECAHCANFHKEVFEKIKSDYIDKGLVKYVVRDFPLSKVGVAGAKLAHCAPKDKYFDFLKTLFESQSVWAFNSKYLESLLNISKLGGISEEKFKECQEDDELQNYILKRAMNASKVFNIQSTPTFFIGKEEISGEAPYAKFKSAIDLQLAR